MIEINSTAQYYSRKYGILLQHGSWCHLRLYGMGWVGTVGRYRTYGRCVPLSDNIVLRLIKVLYLEICLYSVY